MTGTLSFSTYLGGSDDDKAEGIAVDGSGNAYITGYTYSNDFPTKNAYQDTFGGRCDAFVAKVIGIPTDPIIDIKANGSDGPIVVSPNIPVSIAISLEPGDKQGQNADWWVAAYTSFDSPLNWYTYVYQIGWFLGISQFLQTSLFSLPSLEVLNIALPVGTYTFYFGIDDPDAMPSGPWWCLDSVEVTVQ